MGESDQFEEIADLLVATAKAHHATTGGANPQWARWYAEHVIDDLNRVLGAELDVETLEGWLTDADRRYRNEPQTRSWPKAYAGWLIETHG